MTRPIDADHDDMVEIRKFAQSIFAGVQTLDAIEIHPSWARQDDPLYHPDVIDYLGTLLDALKLADEQLWGAVTDLQEGRS